MKPNIENIPCFNQVAQVIGRTQARIALFKAVGWKEWAKANDFASRPTLSDCFSWEDTPQCDKFWRDIYYEINPYTGEKVE